MKLYHGSYLKIDAIDLTKAKPYKDFGRGFYLTKFHKQAKIWADRLGQEHKTVGMISEFEFDEYAYEDESLKILSFEKYNEQWLDFVVLNRSHKNKMHDYDIVEGPVADDKVQTRIGDYLNGEITKTDFLEELKWHEDTHQICFCTVASLQFLKQANTGKMVSKFLHIGEPIVEKLVTDFGLNEETAADKFFSSDTFSKLAEISNKLYEKDWTEIYKLLLNELKL
ncbi:MAG: DUF3990 domain-containing protein [Flavobacteriaceae bacterium]|jgi:hypothetical protein|nr:DUF3990 domain-containing protein [Flavobacteriaceae bacterium]